MKKCIHQSRPCLERLEIGIKPIALYTRCMLWLPTTEAQATPQDRSMDILTEDREHADIDIESTHSSDGTIAIGGPEAVGHLDDLVYGNQDKLTTLIREINDLHQ